MGMSHHEQLELKIASTIKFHFGAICDKIDAELMDEYKTKQDVVKIMREYAYDPMKFFNALFEHLQQQKRELAATLKRRTRDEGNDASRVIANHLQRYKVLRRHELDTPNLERIAKRHQKGTSDGDQSVS